MVGHVEEADIEEGCAEVVQQLRASLGTICQ